MKKLSLLFMFMMVSIFLIGSTNTFAQEDVLTNDEVISLAKAGLNGTIIVNKIRTSKSNFDMSTDALIKLKQAGISDEIVNAMLEAKAGKTVTAASTTTIAAGGNSDPNDPT